MLHTGDTATFTISFDPKVVGADTADLHIVTNDPGSPLDATLTGFGLSPTPYAALTADGNDVGGVKVGATGSSADVETITNDGRPAADHLLDGGSLRDDSRFALTGLPTNFATHPITLAAGQSFQFGVAFTPDQIGLDSATIQITVNDPAHPVSTAYAIGTGLDKVVYPNWGNDFVELVTTGPDGTKTERTIRAAARATSCSSWPPANPTPSASTTR